MDMQTLQILVAIVAAVAVLLTMLPRNARAHCDTMDGPTAQDGMKALDSKNINYALKWIAPEHESELKKVFDLSLKVRELGGAARELADRFFLENLVRIHRVGEGASFLGLKPHGIPVDARVAAAEKSLETGNLDPLKGLVEADRKPELKRRFDKALALKEFSVDDVDSAREYVDAYVNFFKFAEGEEHEHQHHHAHAGAGHAGQHH